MESSSKNHDNGLVDNKSPTLRRNDHNKESKRESLTTSSCKESSDDKENNCHNKGVDFDGRETAAVVPRKFFKNWKQACDRTKDRTKDLLKRWRTLPESESLEQGIEGETSQEKDNAGHGWSVHIWSTWLTRGSEDEGETEAPIIDLSPLQVEKFSHFFNHLLDWDRDEIIAEQDFESLSERLRHFADWSTNSTEFHILQEVQQGFVDAFITSAPPDPDRPSFMCGGTITMDQWLLQWSKIVTGAKNLTDFPLWLQYFSKIIFLVINKSGSGVITRDELRVFYSSFLGFDTQKVGETLDVAFNSMTSNGDHLLRFSVFNLCFCNFLLGRYPHGPGQFLFGPYEGTTLYTALFPIDYSALNSTPEKLEQYSPHKKSNRHSVVV